MLRVSRRMLNTRWREPWGGLRTIRYSDFSKGGIELERHMEMMTAKRRNQLLTNSQVKEPKLLCAPDRMTLLTDARTRARTQKLTPGTCWQQLTIFVSRVLAPCNPNSYRALSFRRLLYLARLQTGGGKEEFVLDVRKL